MQSYPFIAFVTLLFWGWQTGMLPAGLIMGIVLEASRIIRFRLHFKESEYNRISDLCTILFLGCFIYLYSAGYSQQVFEKSIALLPLVIYPLILAQVYGKKEKIGYHSLFYIFRRKSPDYVTLFSKDPDFIKEKRKHEIQPEINMTYPYLIICIISSAAGNSGGERFYTALILFVTLFLFQFRSKRYGLLVWSLFLAMACLGGAAIYTGIIGLEGAIRERVIDFIAGETDPYKSITAIGEIGKLKLSNRILFRINTDPHHLPANGLLLREASYITFIGTKWFAGYGNTFEPVHQEDKKSGKWNLKTYTPIPQPFKNNKEDEKIEKSKQDNHFITQQEIGNHSCDTLAITFSMSFKKRKGLLKLPLHSVAIKDLPAEQLRQTVLGAVKVEMVPNYVTFTVLTTHPAQEYGIPDQCLPLCLLPVTGVDLLIPEKERAIIEKTAESIGVLDSNLSPTDKINTLKKYFTKSFRYSLVREEKSGNSGNQSSLQQFLTETKKGHCEFFATAMVLLLRGAGIPARYATGYIAVEYSGLEKQYIVRKRHAHAWALAWCEGQWRNVDATPSAWAEDEQEMHASPVKKVFDFVSFGLYKFLDWRYANRDKKRVTMLLWLLLPMIVYLVWRLTYKKKVTKVSREKQIMKRAKKPARDTYTIYKDRYPDYYAKFTEIEAKLRQYGFARYSWESLREFIARIKQSDVENSNLKSRLLFEISIIHNKLRFNPDNLQDQEAKKLVHLAEEWLGE